MSNTPFREYKHFAHEGGISSPFIVSWPKGIDPENNGRIERQPGHLIDLMSPVWMPPAYAPRNFGEHDIQPLEGVGLLPTFRGDLVRKDALILIIT